ncbi:MAG: 30S ribosomal protein S6 [Candidatus Omnitrophica bacterium]|nr:30S ribosomal protein S6 [Candidatus Omnitrophota bacterium]
MERVYESMMILVPDIDEESRQEACDKISKKIEQLAGKVMSSRVWAKERNFNFIIRSRAAGKKKYERGTYWLILFSLDTAELPALKETIRLEERILRHIITRKEKHQLAGTSAQ